MWATGAVLLIAAATASHAYEAHAVQGAGTITGAVYYAGLPPARGALEVGKDVAVCGQTAKLAPDLIVSAGGGLRNAVVWLRDIRAGKPFEGGEPILDQRGCEYTPHVVLVPVGEPLTILNPDGILHNIRTAGRQPEVNRPRNRAQPKFKTAMTEVFEHPEFIRVSCDVHRWMQAWIVVQAHPYYAITDADGRFTLTDVPPGTYDLGIWHEALGEIGQSVTVRAGGRLAIDASLGPR